MATTVTSTVPGALAVLLGHFQAVIDANPSLEGGAFLGPPIESEITTNFLMVGNDQTSEMLVGYRQVVPNFPGQVAKEESYGIACSVRAWAGDITPTARLSDAFTLLDGVMSALRVDQTGSGSLTPSGFWHVEEVEMPASGPITGKGWGVVLNFTVIVEGAYIVS